ncbi:MAG: hypothetical protein O3B41_00220 [Bacteroidetes bacterium]|nr:hypothetical protein [Bacteroidota bacterium]
MPHSIYLYLHLIGLILLTLSIGGVLFSRQAGEMKPPKPVSLMHGVGLLFLLVAGFGMMARLGVGWPFPMWIWAKLTLWLLLGGFGSYSKRLSVNVCWIVAISLFLAVVFFGVFQPV